LIVLDDGPVRVVVGLEVVRALVERVTRTESAFALVAS